MKIESLSDEEIMQVVYGRDTVNMGIGHHRKIARAAQADALRQVIAFVENYPIAKEYSLRPPIRPGRYGEGERMTDYNWTMHSWDNLNHQAWLLWNGCFYEFNGGGWVLAPYTITTVGNVCPIKIS